MAAQQHFDEYKMYNALRQKGCPRQWRHSAQWPFITITADHHIKTCILTWNKTLLLVYIGNTLLHVANETFYVTKRLTVGSFYVRAMVYDREYYNSEPYKVPLSHQYRYQEVAVLPGAGVVITMCSLRRCAIPTVVRRLLADWWTGPNVSAPNVTGCASTSVNSDQQWQLIWIVFKIVHASCK